MSIVALHTTLPAGSRVELIGGRVVCYLPNTTRPAFSVEIGELGERAPDLLAYLLAEGLIRET